MGISKFQIDFHLSKFQLRQKKNPQFCDDINQRKNTSPFGNFNFFLFFNPTLSACLQPMSWLFVPHQTWEHPLNTPCDDFYSWHSIRRILQCSICCKIDLSLNFITNKTKNYPSHDYHQDVENDHDCNCGDADVDHIYHQGEADIDNHSDL